MKSSQIPLVDPPGEIVPADELRIPRARMFVRFLIDFGKEAFAVLRETRRRDDPTAEIVVVDIEVERPQDLIHDIRRIESIAVLFREADNDPPEILALRSDFPLVPHVFVAEDELPRRLCLYEEPFENEKPNWTPARFLKRLRFWLARTATGTLHADDQPLEPLIQGSPVRLIVPSDLALSNLTDKAGLLDIYRIDAGKHTGLTLTAQWRNPNNPPEVHAVAAVFCCKPQSHGVMRRQPMNLGDLSTLCESAGLNLSAELGAKIREWHVQKPAPTVLRSQLIIILLLPKTRKEGSIVESVEQWAFITPKSSVEDVGIALDVIARSAGVAGYVLGESTVAPEKIEAIPVAALQVIHALARDRAAAMNGIEPFNKKLVAIGMGALGSQIFNNLIRSGFGQWVLIDRDVFLPHNGARHFLGHWAVGHSKVEAMAAIANAIFDGEPIARAIHSDILTPGDRAEEVAEARRTAELILDFSASIAVTRQLAAAENEARAISAFLTPSGDSLVIGAEDAARAIRLDWLEMLHYRAVLNTPSLNSSLRPPKARFRYGNSCRDVSSVLAQDDAAIWAGVASKAIKELVAGGRAALRIYIRQANGNISVVQPDLADVIRVRWMEWTIQFDSTVLNELAGFRLSKLPNETGGILLGNFDTERLICSITGVVPSPKDSSEWPTSYIRGCAGLRQLVEQVENRTFGQITYVGEWHSHPDECSVCPSKDDLQAYRWLTGYMHGEGLPSIMLIIGEERQFCLVSNEPDSISLSA